MTVKVRFAPSPTGKIHVGNVRTALVNWLFARQQQGEFILRLDDTDRERSTEEFADLIRTDLTWLGLNWDDCFRQSDRMEKYDTAAEKLKAEGRLYPCFETAVELDLKRKIKLGQGKPPVYDRAALSMSEEQIEKYRKEGRRPHWRFRLDLPARVEWEDLVKGHQSFDLDSLSDPILIREDGSYLYTLPSVVDDIEYGITHIMRGEDHATNSAVQTQIFEALGGKTPAYAHFSLLTGKGGEGLSKRFGTASIESYREEEGLEPMAINSLLARLGSNVDVEPFTSLEPLIESFDFSSYSRSTAKFDAHDLEVLNAKILHMTDYEQVKDRAEMSGVSKALWETLRPNLSRLRDVQDWAKLVNGPLTPIIENKDFIAKALELLPEGELDETSWKAWTTAVKDATGAKGKALFLPLRQAVTGMDHGPEMGPLLPLIGRDKLEARLRGETG
ncbi:glutamate--tRNA ligase [Emcibacter sp.]|uniref:glutamate--tRNA ligase n=1 Tax=Emcibacter sp. TaxID=1979954 RepID=UPI002AA71FF0|nr:glutamate--tRNA ligase [Emcibacter sp.]